MEKTPIYQRLRIYFIATTLCLAIITTSMDGGLIKTIYGYGYGYGYGNDNADNDNNNGDTDEENPVIEDTTPKIEGSAVNDQKKSSKKEEKKKKSLKNSQKSVKKGGVLIQSGKGFKKNSKIKLYFSKSDGTFYPPVIVKTDRKGRFSVKYLATKPEGTYKWYAVIPSSGKKTKTSYYKIVK